MEALAPTTQPSIGTGTADSTHSSDWQIPGPVVVH